MKTVHVAVLMRLCILDHLICFKA